MDLISLYKQGEGSRFTWKDVNLYLLWNLCVVKCMREGSVFRPLYEGALLSKN